MNETATLTCGYYHRTVSQFNGGKNPDKRETNLLQMLNTEIPEEVLERGIPILHLKIRLMELTFNVATKLKMKEPKWQGVKL